VALDVDDLAVMQQQVEDGGGDHGIPTSLPLKWGRAKASIEYGIK
jgi:hypothetical protein